MRWHRDMFPPAIRRLFSTPTGIVLTVMAFFSIVGILSVFNVGNVTLLPESWTTGDSGFGWAVKAGAAARKCKHARLDSQGVCCSDDEKDDSGLCVVGTGGETLPGNTLPDLYATHFPDLQLPASLRTPILAPLAERLEAFLARPALSQAEAAEANRAGCPLHISDNQANLAMLMNGREFWESIQPEDIAARRAELVFDLANAAADGARLLGDPRPAHERNSTRGIVMTGGNQDTTFRVITALRHLRRIGNELPVEVVHFSDELHDKAQREELEQLGARLVRARGASKIDGAWKNYQIKGVALIESSFDELIYLDSDNTPLRSLEHLFDSPRYLDGGRAAFWPDISKDHTYNAVWRLVGDTCSLDEWTFESGQMVIDKNGNGGLNKAALYIAAAMMAHHDFWFNNLCGGDKDTFRWAWRMLDLPYATSPRWLSALGFHNQFDNGRFCGHTMLQYDLDVPPGGHARPLFVHSNLLKHLGGGLNHGDVYTHIKRFVHDDAPDQSLNYAFMYVYQGPGRGMCLDMEMHGNTPEGLDQYHVTNPVSDYPDFEGFEDAWWDEGGRVGGW